MCEHITHLRCALLNCSMLNPGNVFKTFTRLHHLSQKQDKPCHWQVAHRKASHNAKVKVQVPKSVAVRAVFDPFGDGEGRGKRNP